MRVEGRDLVHLGLRQAHLLGQRRQMARGEMAVAVLDEVQEFDQQVAPPLARAQQRLHLRERGRIDLPPFGMRARLSPPRGRGNAAVAGH